MSGAKRNSRHRKQVETDTLSSFPEPQSGEEVALLVEARGGNVMQIRTGSGEDALCRLPNKYKHLIWVKKGTFMIVRKYGEGEEVAVGGKIRYEVEHVLMQREQIRHLVKAGLWPKEFEASLPMEKSEAKKEEGLFVNSNRRIQKEEEEEDDEKEDS